MDDATPAPDEDEDARLTSAIQSLTDEVKGLRKFGNRTRTLLRVLGASLAFDVLLTVGLGITAENANTASNKASKASSDQVITCRSGNATRLVQKQLWDYILALPPSSSPRSPKEQQQIAAFKTYIADAFKPRVC